MNLYIKEKTGNKYESMKMCRDEKTLKSKRMVLLIEYWPIANVEMDLHRVIKCLFGFYGISSFGGYLMPNPFLYK